MSSFKISQYIKVDHSYLRSINLERDANNKQILKRFHITPLGYKVLNRLADSLHGESINAWSLTGPYGSGKSAFCNFMFSMFCGDFETRQICFEKLNEYENNLASKLKKYILINKDTPFAISIRNMSKYEPLNITITRGLYSTLTILPKWVNYKLWFKLRKNVEQLLKNDRIDTSKLISAVKELNNITDKPIFIVVDEFGKNLEYQAHHEDQGDIFALQALAETKSIFIWVCLHQAFSSYGSILNSVQKKEWQKIQGRFEDIAFVEPPSRSFSIIQEVLHNQYHNDEFKESLTKWANAIRDEISHISLDGISQLNENSIMSIYPFHPLSVFFLGEMSRLFGQNDRTIFSFLTSGEPFAFSECVKKLEISNTNTKKIPILGLDMLYDYFSELNVLRNADRYENQRWLEIRNMITSQKGLEPLKIKLLKTIGTINLLSSLRGVKASREIIHFALASTYYENQYDIENMLQELVKKGILLFRSYANEYRLWEGSDFDLDQEVLKIRAKVALQPINETLEKILPRQNIVAARHSYQSTTFREFSVKWCTENDINEIIENSKDLKSKDGILWLMLGKGKIPEEVFLIAHEGKPIIIAYAPYLNQVQQLLLEAAATHEVCSAPQLERDGIARREAHYRFEESVQNLKSFLEGIFMPGIDGTVWIAEGKKKNIRNQRELSSLLSDLCDHVYYLSPKINNEMINVNHITNIATTARNKVAEALANNYFSENLNLSGFGPEVAIYRTLIKETGLHRKNPQGKLILSAPDKENQPELSAIWDLINKLLVEAEEKNNALPIIKIYEKLKQPPFGMREGPIPLFLIHFLLVNADEVAVYEGDEFKPFFGDAEARLLIRRPELFSLRSYKPAKIDLEVIQIYSQVINTGFNLIDRIRNNTLLSIVVPLIEFYKSLPEFTKKTRSLGFNAIRLRNALAYAIDPKKLIFHDIPKALGLVEKAVESCEKSFDLDFALFRETLWQALSELDKAYDIFVEKAKACFISSMCEDKDNKISLEFLRNKLKKTASFLLPICVDSDAKPVLSVLAQENGEDNEWFDRVATIIMKKPLHSWQDADLERFSLYLKEIYFRLQQLLEIKKISEKKKIDNRLSRYIGIAYPDGRIVGKKIFLSYQPDNITKDTLEAFNKADQLTRIKFLAAFIDFMEKKGDFR